MQNINKQNVLHHLIKEVSVIRNYYLNKLTQYLYKRSNLKYLQNKSIPDLFLNDFELKIIINTLKSDEEYNEIYDAYSNYDKECKLIKYYNWYFIQILNHAKYPGTAKKCLPSYLHRYIDLVHFNGTITEINSLLDPYLYDNLTEVPLKRTLLGI